MRWIVKLNARIIAVDHPGYGLSDPKRGRTILAWPDDVVELADALALDQFAVLGISGGGPYASACAFKIPERLTTTAIVCGMGPTDAPRCKEGASWISPGKPAVMRWPLLKMRAMAVHKSPEKFIVQMNESVSEPDRALLHAHPELAMMIAEDWREAFRSGIGGANQESALHTRPWGFSYRKLAPTHTYGTENRITTCQLQSDIMLLTPSPTARPRSLKMRGISPLSTTIWKRLSVSWLLEIEPSALSVTAYVAIQPVNPVNLESVNSRASMRTENVVRTCLRTRSTI